MIGFRQHYLIEAAKAPKIVMLYASETTNFYLNGFYKRLGFDLSKSYSGNEIKGEFPFHITLLASNTPVDLPETTHAIAPIVVEPKCYGTLGENQTPVLKVYASAALTEKRAYFTDTYGMVPTFAKFIPHVSISYASKLSLDNLPLPAKPLIFDKLVIKEFEPD